VTAAFFDVDNTVVKGSSLFLIGRGLIAHGVVRRRDVARYALVQVLFRLRGEHLDQLAGAQDRALALGAGLLVDDVVATGRQVYEERVAGRLWPQTVALARATSPPVSRCGWSAPHRSNSCRSSPDASA